MPVDARFESAGDMSFDQVICSLKVLVLLQGQRNRRKPMRTSS